MAPLLLCCIAPTNDITPTSFAAFAKAELYCSILYKQFGIATPQMRVLGMPEWRSMVEELGKVCFTSPGAGTYIHTTYIINLYKMC